MTFKPHALGPGQTFLDVLIPQLEGYSTLKRTRGSFGANTDAYVTYQLWLNALRHADTRRFLFDAAQAEQFAPLIEFPESWQDHVHEPFPHFYMEFSDPVALATEAWAVNENDYLRGIIYSTARPVRVAVGRNPLLVGAPPLIELRSGSHLVLFFYDPVTDTYTDRNFVVDIKKGLVYVSRYMAERTFEWRNAPDAETQAKRIAHDAAYGSAKQVLDDFIARGDTDEGLSRADLESLKAELIPVDAHDRSTGLEFIPDDRATCFIAGDFAEGRNIGWWERQAMAATSFVQWCLSYMMAKSIVVEIRDISRQQKRWLQRHNKPWPKPWHVVMVDPKYVRTLENSEETGFKHSYRYDVMGHLRVGRHRVGTKKEDGTYSYRQILEWVPPHQRGLANELYIPATRAIKAGRKVPSEIRNPKGGLE